MEEPDLNQIKDLLEKYLVASRASMSPGMVKELSADVKELKRTSRQHSEIHTKDISEAKEQIENLTRELVEMKQEVKPMFEAYKNVTGFKASIIWVSTLVAGMVGTIIGLKTLFKHLGQ